MGRPFSGVLLMGQQAARRPGRDNVSPTKLS